MIPRTRYIEARRDACRALLLCGGAPGKTRTAKRLASAVGVSRSYVYRMLAGEGPVGRTMDLLLRLVTRETSPLPLLAEMRWRIVVFMSRHLKRDDLRSRLLAACAEETASQGAADMALHGWLADPTLDRLDDLIQFGRDHLHRLEELVATAQALRWAEGEAPA